MGRLHLLNICWISNQLLLLVFCFYWLIWLTAKQIFWHVFAFCFVQSMPSCLFTGRLWQKIFYETTKKTPFFNHRIFVSQLPAWFVFVFFFKANKMLPIFFHRRLFSVKLPLNCHRIVNNWCIFLNLGSYISFPLSDMQKLKLKSVSSNAIRSIRIKKLKN